MTEIKEWRDKYANKCNGDDITALQMKKIKSGNLDVIKLGSYWLIDGIHWRVADREYFYGKNGNKKHDLVLVPDEPIGYGPMNKRKTIELKSKSALEYDVSNGEGYYGADARERLQEIAEKLPDCIKKNMLKVKFDAAFYTSPRPAKRSDERLFVPAPKKPFKSEYAVKDSTGIELMSIAQVYGPDYMKSGLIGVDWVNLDKGYDSSPQDEQLGMFKFTSEGKKVKEDDYKTMKASNIVKDRTYWLASTVLDNSFAICQKPLLIDRHNHTKYHDCGHSLSSCNSGDRNYYRPMIVIG